MSSFTGIGSFFDQQSDTVQQPAALHWPGCPDPYSQPELCYYCHQAARAITLPNPLEPQIDTQEQYFSQDVGQEWTYATPDEEMQPCWDQLAPTRTIATESRWHGHPGSMPIPPSSSTATGGPSIVADTTYAQVLQYPNRNFTPYYVQPTRDTRTQQQFRSPIAGRQMPQSTTPSWSGIQEFEWRVSRGERPQNRVEPRPSPRSSFSSALAQLPEEALLQTQAGASIVHEENVAGMGRLRLGIPPDEGYNSAIMSQGTPSVRSANSQRSERRTGNALRVRNETFTFTCRFANCGTTFPDAQGLRRHEDRVHKSKDQRTYSCSRCTQKFHDPKDCNRHELTHIDISTRKTFTCRHPNCPKVFTRNDNMQRHMRADHKVDSGVCMSRQASYSSHNSLPY